MFAVGVERHINEIELRDCSKPQPLIDSSRAHHLQVACGQNSTKKNDCRRIQVETRLPIQPSFVPGPAAFPGMRRCRIPLLHVASDITADQQGVGARAIREQNPIAE